MTAISSLLEALKEFQCQDTDEESNPKYYGFCNKEGKWYITRETLTSNSYTYRYAGVSSNPLIDSYGTAWTNRASLSYVYTYQIQI